MTPSSVSVTSIVSLLLTEVRVSGSPSGSLSLTARRLATIWIGTSSSVTNPLLSRASGASLTGVTSTVTVASARPPSGVLAT